MNANGRSTPPLSDLLGLQSHAVEALYACALGYNGSARTEIARLCALWEVVAEQWTDAEGQRVGLWMREFEWADRQSSREGKFAVRSQCCYRIWRLLQRRLARRLDYDWPEGGLMLDLPRSAPADQRELATVDEPPFHPVKIEIIDVEGLMKPLLDQLMAITVSLAQDLRGQAKHELAQLIADPALADLGEPGEAIRDELMEVRSALIFTDFDRIAIGNTLWFAYLRIGDIDSAMAQRPSSTSDSQGT